MNSSKITLVFTVQWLYRESKMKSVYFTLLKLNILIMLVTGCKVTDKTPVSHGGNNVSNIQSAINLELVKNLIAAGESRRTVEAVLGFADEILPRPDDKGVFLIYKELKGTRNGVALHFNRDNILIGYGRLVSSPSVSK